MATTNYPPYYSKNNISQKKDDIPEIIQGIPIHDDIPEIVHNDIPKNNKFICNDDCKKKCKPICINMIFILCILICITTFGFSIYGLTFKYCQKNICKFNSTPYCCDNDFIQSCHEYTEYNSFTKCDDINKKCNEFKCKLTYNNMTKYVGYDETDKIYDIPGGLPARAFSFVFLFLSIIIGIILFCSYFHYKKSISEKIFITSYGEPNRR